MITGTVQTCAWCGARIKQPMWLADTPIGQVVATAPYWIDQIGMPICDPTELLKKHEPMPE